MKIIRVEKGKLINILKTNRQLHIDEYQKAEDEFRMAGIAALEEKLDEFTKANNDTALSIHIPLSAPESHEQDYDDAIEMLNVSCDETIELDEHEAQNLIMDNWNWSGQLGHTRAMYAGFLKKG